MRIAVLHGPRDLRIEEHPLDTNNLGPHDVWVKAEITGFKIGTDRGNYEGAEQVPDAPGYPRWVGDSSMGTVRGVGSDVTRFKPGDRLIARVPHQSEFVTDELSTAVKVPDGVDAEDAVWAHLYTLSGLCYHKAFFRPGENVAVVGLGVLGLGAVALGPLFGGRVVGLGNSPVRLEMAERMGAHAAYMSDDSDLKEKLDEFTMGAGIDLVILTANPWPALRTSMDVVRQDGRVSVVSLLGRGEPPLDFNPLAMEWFYLKGIALIAVNGAAGYLYPTQLQLRRLPETGGPPGLLAAPQAEERFSWNRSCEHLLTLMAEGKLEPKLLITHRLHYTEMAKAYEMAYHREKTMLGVTFDWRDADG